MFDELDLGTIMYQDACMYMACLQQLINQAEGTTDSEIHKQLFWVFNRLKRTRPVNLPEFDFEASDVFEDICEQEATLDTLLCI